MGREAASGRKTTALGSCCAHRGGHQGQSALLHFGTKQVPTAAETTLLSESHPLVSFTN